MAFAGLLAGFHPFSVHEPTPVAGCPPAPSAAASEAPANVTTASRPTLADLFFHFLIDTPPHMIVHGQMTTVRMVVAKRTPSKWMRVEFSGTGGFRLAFVPHCRKVRRLLDPEPE